MPKKLALSPWVTWSGLKKMIVGGGAIVAFVGAFVSNYQQIIDFFLTPDNVKVGWLSVADPGTLKECVIKNNSNVFPLSDGQQVQLASNTCLAELRTLLPQNTTVPKNTPQIQKINASYFLLIKNQGEQISQMLLKSNSGSQQQDMVFRNIDKGASIAICMGYDGNAGTPSKMSNIVEIKVKRHARMELNIDVPERGQGTPVGVSDCGPIVWHYPR